MYLQINKVVCKKFPIQRDNISETRKQSLVNWYKNTQIKSRQMSQVTWDTDEKVVIIRQN